MRTQSTDYTFVDDFEHWLRRAKIRAAREFTAREIEDLTDLYRDGYCVLDALNLLSEM